VKSLLSIIFAALAFQPIFGAQVIKINPEIKYQTIEGWGVSLMWWAHQVGDTFSDAQIDTLCTWLVSPDELNMNIFRYNIGGGDNPAHHHMRPDAQMPGYLASKDAPYDWSQDAGQRKILLKIHQLKKNAIYEAANYSPPYWMTISGCSSGNTDGSDNLQNQYYKAFSDYLTTVVKHYHDVYGIRFRTLSPFNEPFSSWWKAYGSQEGCAFSQANQERLIKTLYANLKKKDMLSYCTIAAMDANSMDECLRGVEDYEKDGVLPFIGQINTHSYNGVNRDSLYLFAQKHHIRLWQSESGPLDIKFQGYDNFLMMGKRIVTDMRQLKPVAWCDWQYMSGGLGSVWALVGYNENSKVYERTKGFYIRKQFSKYILPGYAFIGDSDNNSIAAISPDGKKLVIVYVNELNDQKPLQFDLSSFSHATLQQALVTSEKENCKEASFPIPIDSLHPTYLMKPKSIATFVYDIQQ
jgi:O-glycosyl hydrolase